MSTPLFRYDIQPASIADFRSTTVSAQVAELTPDGFVCDEETGDKLLAEHQWAASKTVENAEGAS